MAEGAGTGRILGYCTNVHAGQSLERTLRNLDRHAVAVRQLHCPGRTLDLGLWLSAAAARQVIDRGPAELAAWLAERGLRVFTLNGFPYGDFHYSVVKYDVYRPDWKETKRFDYTLDLARILAAILPEGAEGSISTLPIGWNEWLDGNAVHVAARELRLAAAALHKLYEETGRLIHLDLEPEPGCVLQRSADVVRFFEEEFRGGPEEDIIRRHLRVCHDICHAAVMFENQAAALRRYAAAGILVGKVQISSALRARSVPPGAADRRDLLAELSRFAEKRYLHQTCVRDATGARRFYVDLPDALAEAPAGEWRVHFHVPVYLRRIGLLQTTRRAIGHCLLAPRAHPEVHHFEVETYAWDVLPEELRTKTLAESIAEELTTCRAMFDAAAASQVP